MGADNQQETSKLFYYTGFCVGELSCSLLRLSNRKSKIGGVYYTPDITISNADLSLLKEINSVVGSNLGIITKIKGGFNLSFRGKEKVKVILSFFTKFPPITGDLVRSRIYIISQALLTLEKQEGYRRNSRTLDQLEKYREVLRIIKKTGVPFKSFSKNTKLNKEIGYFLSGVFDAEGSVGMKQSGNRRQPFVAIAMKDRKIVDLFYKFFGLGNIHIRPKQNVYHWESGSKQSVLKIIHIFSKVYPSKLLKMKLRMEKVRRILNDYTLSP